MTKTLGGLSLSVIAVIAVGGVAVLLAIMIGLAVLFDLPKRMKRKQDDGIMEPSSKKSLEISEVEKGSVDASITEVSLKTNSSTNYSSMYPTRPASPECSCEHPVVSHNPPRL